VSEHVLVVDDEPQILRALRVILRNAGYDVDTAKTKSEAKPSAENSRDGDEPAMSRLGSGSGSSKPSSRGVGGAAASVIDTLHAA